MTVVSESKALLSSQLGTGQRPGGSRLRLERPTDEGELFICGALVSVERDLKKTELTDVLSRHELAIIKAIGSLPASHVRAPTSCWWGCSSGNRGPRRTRRGGPRRSALRLPGVVLLDARGADDPGRCAAGCKGGRRWRGRAARCARCSGARQSSVSRT